MLGGSTRPLPVLAPALAVLAVAGLLPLAVGTRRTAGPVEPARRGWATRRPRPAAWRAAWIALLGVRIPVASNDEYALWMLKARVLSQLGGLDPRVFADTGAGYQHQTYPLFLPSLVSWLDGWAGRPTDAAAHLAVAVTVGALLAVAGAVLTRLAGPAAAAVSLLLVVSIPTLLSRQSLLLMADVPVFAFAFCLALVLMLVRRRCRRRTGRSVAGRRRGARRRRDRHQGGGAGLRRHRLRRGAAAGHRPPARRAGRRRRRRAGQRALAALRPAAPPAQLGAQRRHAQLGAPAGVLPWTGYVLRGMAERWPGGSGLGAVLVVAILPAAVLAVRAGQWRLVVFAAAVVLLDSAVLLAQYVVTAYGPASDPLSRPLLDSQLDVTVFRVTLLPAALLAVAVPVFAGSRCAPIALPLRATLRSGT